MLAVQRRDEFACIKISEADDLNFREAGADAFAIQNVAGHSTITISQRYVHPTEERIEDAFSGLERYNAKKAEELELKRRATGEIQSAVPVPPESPTDDQNAVGEADANLNEIRNEPWRNRTSNLLIKSQLLCQLS